MGKKTILWLAIGAILTVLGLIVFAAVMTSLHWDFTSLSTVTYETNTYRVTEPFSGISLNTDTADITFLPTDDGTCKVVCFEETTMPHRVSVQEGVLTVEATDERKWHEHIGIGLRATTITVYLPACDYGALSIEEDTGDVEIPAQFRFESMDISASTGDVSCHASVSGAAKIKTSTGAITVEDISADTLTLSVSTGKVTLSDVSCQGELKLHVSTGKATVTDVQCGSFLTAGNTGDVTLKDVVAADTLSVTRTTGGVKLDGCDAGAIRIQTDTGDVTGSLLTDKVFITQTDTGRVEVPQTFAGGECRISTNTGDILITVE